MAIGQMVDGAGCHDLLAAHCKCMQCGQDLSAISYERRVAHVKKCAEQTKQRANSAGHSQVSGTAGSVDMRHLQGCDLASGAESGEAGSAAACIVISKGVEGILAQLGMEVHMPAFHKEEVDIRALPELSDEDLIYLGVSDTSQRRTLLQIARTLKKSGAHCLRGLHSTAPAFQLEENSALSAVAQCMPSPTPATRRDSHDSRGSPQGMQEEAAAPATAAAATAPPLTCDSSSCKIVQQCSRTVAEDKADTAGLSPANHACKGLGPCVTSIAGPKRSAGKAFAALPPSNGSADFAEQPERDTRVLSKLAKLSRSALSRRKPNRAVTSACSMPTAAAAAANQHLSAGLSVQDMPRKQHSAVLQGTRKASSVLSKAASAKHQFSSVSSVQDPLSKQHAAVPEGAEAHAASRLQSPPLSKPGRSSEILPSSRQPSCLEALPVAGRPKQALDPKALPDGGNAGPKHELQPCGEAKPAAYLSGALGRLLATRSVRACVSQNGSYSRQAELRLLAFLYPGEEGQDCSSTSWRQHNRRRADVWSSDDEETAGREGNPPPLAGYSIKVPGVHQVPKEASLWALSHQDSQRQCTLQSIQQRQAARKAAGLGAQAAHAQQPLQSLQPSHGAVSRLEASANSVSVPEQSLVLAAGPTPAQELGQDVQASRSDPVGVCPALCTASVSVAAGARQKEVAACSKGRVLTSDRVNSNKALRVHSLRQELVAAEAVVAELKSWLADAEAEVEEDRVTSR